MMSSILKTPFVLTGCLAACLVLFFGCKPAEKAADSGNAAAPAQVESGETFAVAPTLYAELPDDMYGPDALYYDPDADILYLTVPNFPTTSETPLSAPPVLTRINKDGTVDKVLEFQKIGDIERTGCMGLQKGADGNLYVCDNQYFYDPNYKSRLLRVVMKDGAPTGEVQEVVKGFKVANAILWDGDRVFVTDTILDEEGKYGSGGIWMFNSEDIIAAGTDGDHPALELAQKDDPRLIIIEDCEDVGNGNKCGADGIAKAPDGVYYFGNFGDGAMFRFKFDGETGKPVVEQIHKGGDLFDCSDGFGFDEKTGKFYFPNSFKNSIWSFAPTPWGEPVSFEKIWENEDTDGSNGLLDLPSECRPVNGQLFIVNQDVGVGTSGKNQKTDKPYSVSVISLP